jgi:hypothetical protein
LTEQLYTHSFKWRLYDKIDQNFKRTNSIFDHKKYDYFLFYGLINTFVFIIFIDINLLNNSINIFFLIIITFMI